MKRKHLPVSGAGIPRQRVVITGMGITSAIGQNLDEFRQSLRQGRTGIGFSGQGTAPNIGAFMGEFSLSSSLERFSGMGEDRILKAKKCAQRSPFSVQASVISALEAWNAAHLEQEPIPSHRLGIIVAGSNVSQNYQCSFHEKYSRAPEYMAPSYALHFMDTDQVGTLSEIFTIHGEGFTVGGASASGNVGIIKGFQLIQLGIVDACLVVGSLTDLSPVELQAFSNLGVMGGKRFQDRPEMACRPFDTQHEGFIYGQGSGCLVLESLPSAKNRGAVFFAEILGGALVLDGNRLSDPSEEGEAKAMETALKQAGIEAQDVDYINAHATSTPLGDITEIKAIKKVFKDHISRIWINSTKGLTGHCLSAAGVIEAIAAAVQIGEGFIHPNLNLEIPIDKECRFGGATSSPAEIKVCLSNSFGFGGINTSIIFRKGD